MLKYRLQFLHGKEVRIATGIHTDLILFLNTVFEAVHLLDIGVSPYDGDTFHETPVLLYIYRWLIKNWPNLIPILFIIVDVLTAVIISISCYKQLKDSAQWEAESLSKLKDKDLIKKLSIDRNGIQNLAVLTGTSYLLLPYTVLSCVGLSTSTFYNFEVSLLILLATKNFRVAAMALAAFIAHTSMYGVVLVVPAALAIEHQRSRDQKTNKCIPINFSGVDFIGSGMISCATFVTFLGIFTYFSSWLMDFSPNWINGTYMFQLSVTDLTPNVGVFWYFFTEMFDHFRDFFLWTFQINAFLYTIPIAVCLRSNPYIVFFLQLALLSILKPYPSISDLSLYLPLLVQWSHLKQCKYKCNSVGHNGIKTLLCRFEALPDIWHNVGDL